MKRRDFIVTACGVSAATATGVMTQSTMAHDLPNGKHLIEWCVFTCKNAEKKKKLIEIFDNALVPALNRQSINPVGIFETSSVFNSGDKSYDTVNDLRVFVLCNYVNIDQKLQMIPKLIADKQYMADAAEIFNAPMSDPIYDSCESALMVGLDHCPKIEVPSLVDGRVLQIRFYNSYNIERNTSKIDMFDIGGELELFKKCQMLPVFFGETLVGRMMPNLTYMLSFKSMADKEASWQTFVTSPEWKALSSDPTYKDTANKIVNIMLKPSAKSQI